MKLNHKVRLYPDSTMKRVLDNSCDYRRYCWNKGLELWNQMDQDRHENLPQELRVRIRDYYIKKDRTIQFSDDDLRLMDQYPAPSEYKVRNSLVANKKDWMYEYSSRILQLAVKDLAKAWAAFWKKVQARQGRPKFKSKKLEKQGFKTDTARIKDGLLILDKPKGYKGGWYGIRFRGYQIPDGPLKLVAITRRNDKYYAVITREVEIKAKLKTGEKTGVDANVKHFDTVNGSFDVFPKQLQNLYDQIRAYQRLLARKERERKESGESISRRELVMRTKLRACYEKMTNIQHDLVHKFTNELTSLYDVIVIEDLNVKGMLNSKRCKNLHRSLFGFFREVLTYKCERDGKRLVVADRTYPSTQRCSSCGYIKTGDDRITLYGNQKHGTKHHEYICYECGFEADRDYNAVLNLLALAE